MGIFCFLFFITEGVKLTLEVTEQAGERIWGADGVYSVCSGRGWVGGAGGLKRKKNLD